MRLGLIADTHMPGSIDALWPHALNALSGADIILHAGDLHTLEIVDELEKLAPVYVARGNGDAGIVDDRLQDHWLLDVRGVSVGMIHHFPSPVRKSPETIRRYIAKHFHGEPDVVVFGHTHLEGVHVVEDLLLVNPGSPTLPQNQSLRPGTLGMMEVTEDHVVTTLFQLTDHGVEPHAVFDHHLHPHPRREQVAGE